MIDTREITICPFCGESPVDIREGHDLVTLFDRESYTEIDVCAAWCNNCRKVVKDYVINKNPDMESPYALPKKEDIKKFNDLSFSIIKEAAKEDFLKLFNDKMLDNKKEETAVPKIEDIFTIPESVDKSSDLSTYFNDEGFKVNYNRNFQEIPYKVLLYIANMGTKAIGKTIPCNGDHILINERVYQSAQQAINLLKGSFYSVEKGIQELSRSAAENITKKISTRVLNSKGQMEDKDYTEVCPLCGETVDMHSGRDFLSLYDSYHNDFIEVNINAVWCPKCYGVLESYVGTQGTEYSGKEFEISKEEKTMKFNGIKNIDHLIRKADWQETVKGFNKIAFNAMPEENENDLRNKLLQYLNKDEQKYRGKIKKYKGELERIKGMKQQLLTGVSFEEINRGLEEPIFDETDQEFDQRLENSKLNEISENEAYEKMLWNNKSKDNLII